MINENLQLTTSIYNLFYKNPLFEYACFDKKGSASINLMIVGSGAVAYEVFKTAFWAGQIDKCSLNILLASEDCAVWENYIHNNMPSLKKHRDYANIEFSMFDYVTLKKNAELFEKYPDVNYIVVATNDNETNEKISKSLKQIIPSKNGHAIICRYNSLSTSKVKTKKILSKVYEYIFGSESKFDADLLRVAKNINYSYSSVSNKRLNKEEEDKKLCSDKYNLVSSCASALHIPYKMFSCELFLNKNKLLEDYNSYTLLLDSIGFAKSGKIPANNKEKCLLNLYNSLIYLEHRRWNAEKISAGYDCPSVASFKKYAFNNGNSHIDKERKLHPCICEASRDGINKNIWNSERCDLSELDQASVNISNALWNKIKDINPYSLVMSILKSDVAYSGLEQSLRFKECTIKNLSKKIGKMLAGEDNSYALFDNEIKQAIIEANSKPSKNILLNVIDKIYGKKTNEEISLIIKWATKTNYYEYDAQLINMIPYCVQHEKNDNLLLVFTSGITNNNKAAAMKDVLIPTALQPKEVKFIGEFNDSAAYITYKKLIRDYFHNKGNNTTVSFKKISFNDSDVICKYLLDLVSDGRALVAYESLANNIYLKKALDQLYKTGKIDFLTNFENSIYINQNHSGFFVDSDLISINEFIKLINGSQTNESEISHYIEPQSFIALMELFKEYSQIESCDTGKSLWKKVIESCPKKVSDETIIDLKDYDNKTKENIVKLLIALNENRIFNIKNAGERSFNPNSSNDKYCISLPNTKIQKDFNNNGKIFELFIWYSLHNCYASNEIQTSVKFDWYNNSDSNDDSNVQHSSNEIDVIVANGEHPIFISCKDTNSIDPEFVYEIGHIAAKANGYPVLIANGGYEYFYNFELRDKSHPSRIAIKRAADMDVSLLTREIIFDDKKLKEAIERIKKGHVVCNDKIIL